MVSIKKGEQEEFTNRLTVLVNNWKRIVESRGLVRWRMNKSDGDVSCLLMRLGFRNQVEK